MSPSKCAIMYNSESCNPKLKPLSVLFYKTVVFFSECDGFVYALISHGNAFCGLSTLAAKTLPINRESVSEGRYFCKQRGEIICLRVSRENLKKNSY